MKNWQFAILILSLFGITWAIARGNARNESRLQYIQEILEEQWTIMDSSAYEKIDRYKDMPEGELFEAEQF
jgi:hypothetical protein